MQKIFTTRVKTNLNGVLQMTQMVNGIMMTGDNAANQIIVELYNDFDKVVIPDGTKITGYFIRSDGNTIEVDGSVNEEGEAVVIIPETAYQVSGSMSIAIRLFEDSRVDTYKGYYRIVVKRGYYDSTSDIREFVEVTDPETTEGPHGEPVSDRVITTNEFVQITDLGQTEGPNGEPILEKTFNTWGTKIVIATLTCYVRITESDSLIDEYHHIPDVQELLAYLQILDSWRQNVIVEENGRVEAEEVRVTAETARQAAEADRASAENIRIVNENARIPAEANRISNENARIAAENTRRSNEDARISAEATRISNENARIAAENTRSSNEDARISAEATRVSNEAIRVSKETARQTAEATRLSAEATRVSNENTRIANETAREAAEANRETNTTAAITKINDMTVSATKLDYYTDPTVAISEVDGHKHIAFGIAPGDPFVIAKTFETVSLMESYNGEDLRVGQFVLIASNTEDPDNAKMYVVTAAKPKQQSNTFVYVTDLSGAQGIKGDAGNGIASISVRPDYTLRITYTDGTVYTSGSIRGPIGLTGNGITNANVDENYKLNLTFSDGTTYQSESIRGDTGAVGPTGPKGPIGLTGNGISDANVDENYKLNLTFTDGTTYQSGSIRGAQGLQGEKGDKGDRGEDGIGSISFNYDSASAKLTVIYN